MGETAPEDKSARAWLALFLMLVALFGHTLVFLAFYRERKLRTLQNIIIVNLSVADFLFSAIVPSTHVVRLLRRKTTLSEAPCYITGVASMLLCLTSINTLTFISIERFMATNYPIKHRRYFDIKLVKVVLIVIWCWSAMLSALPSFTAKYVFLETFFHCSPDWASDLGTTLTLAVFGIGAPLAILSYCGYHIVHALRKSRQIHTNNANRQISNSRAERERRMSLLTITVVVTFTICWAPYCVAMLCLARGKCGFPENFMLLALMLSILNSSCNPIIYGMLNKKFRRAFKNILTCKHQTSLGITPSTTGT
ncbi:rhodopsin, GQ-coupled-like [Dendronephthya gigantea]|uniref:rhodopsin, GQ-coupled-like n=1 Tax=Dendronephthya gigantea TaxID=151771 RepID=UPI00106DC40A|nr:rhodopsin, GQ-coupled-like [Dendronephthya gigantea]